MALQHAGELHCRQSVHSHAWPELAEELTPPQMAAAAAHAVQELQQLVASRHQPGTRSRARQHVSQVYGDLVFKTIHAGMPPTPDRMLYKHRSLPCLMQLS